MEDLENLNMRSDHAAEGIEADAASGAAPTPDILARREEVFVVTDALQESSKDQSRTPSHNI